jgi:hypothetical protein
MTKYARLLTLLAGFKVGRALLYEIFNEKLAENLEECKQYKIELPPDLCEKLDPHDSSTLR